MNKPLLLHLLFVAVLFSVSSCQQPAATTEVVEAKPLNLYWIDVEGGAATLLVTPSGESVLFDTGNPGERDAGRIHHVATEVAGLKQIDHLVTTHFHLDHFGGAAPLSELMPILRIYDKGIPDSLPEDQNFAERIQPYRDIQVQERHLIVPGYSLPLLQSSDSLLLSINFFGADRIFVPIGDENNPSVGCGEIDPKGHDGSDNGNSSAFIMEFGSFRFFHGADLTWNVEETLVCPENLPGEVDLFQVNHHGLDQSNHPVLVRNLSPTVSVMNNGNTKGGGPETITTLRNTPSIKGMYQVHKNNREDSEFNTEDEFIANLVEECEGNFIQLTVAPDGKSYKVSIPSNGHEATYITKGE